MIHPLLPNQLQKTQETMRMAAEFILRPISRKYDKAEHEPPVEMEQLNQAAAAQKKDSEIGDDSVKSMDLGGRNLWAVISLEQMCWGDVGLFLARPGTGLGNAAIMAVGDNEQKAKWGKRWAAMAITEPGAGARIIAGMLEAAESHKGTCMLLVTHLAPAIIEAAGRELRTDGIEARGLDENLELIVDRTPRRNHLARSTPELIVRRLVERSQGDAKDVFKSILGRF